MAGSLIKIDEEIVTSAVASVTLGASNWDSSYDVYKVIHSNVTGTVDDTHLRLRVLKASDSSPDTSSNYDEAAKLLRADTTFGNSSSTNQDFGRIQATGTGTATGEVTNCVYYLFNFNNASEYNFLTNEETQLGSTGTLFGSQGGLVSTVAQLSNGLIFFMNSGNIASGTFTLYGLNK
jgi:hypothetical protein